jgi:hypothetical protein
VAGGPSSEPRLLLTDASGDTMDAAADIPAASLCPARAMEPGSR